MPDKRPAFLQPIDKKPPSDQPEILRNRGTSAYIRTDTFDNHMEGMSLTVLWEKSYLCPCRNKKTRQPEQACEVCHGRGVAYLPPKELKMQIQSQEKGIMNADLGLFESGTAIGTHERGVKIAFRDRITVKDAKVSQSLIFDATERRINNGFYLIYDVHYIELAVIKGRSLKYGTDYEFDRDKNLFIPKKHLKGENISINIETTLRYMVADLLKEHRYSQDVNGKTIQLSQKLLLKREDIFVDKEHFDNNETDGQMIETKRQPVDGLNGFFGGGGR